MELECIPAVAGGSASPRPRPVINTGGKSHTGKVTVPVSVPVRRLLDEGRGRRRAAVGAVNAGYGARAEVDRPGKGVERARDQSTEKVTVPFSRGFEKPQAHFRNERGESGYHPSRGRHMDFRLRWDCRTK